MIDKNAEFTTLTDEFGKICAKRIKEFDVGVGMFLQDEMKEAVKKFLKVVEEDIEYDTTPSDFLNILKRKAGDKLYGQ